MKAAVAMLTAFLVAGGGCRRSSQGEFHADQLKIDGRYSQEIQFEALGGCVPLARNAYVRVDPLVADATNHIRFLLRELGASANITYSNSARNGGELHLRFRDGKECSFIWVRRDADSRLTRMRLEHEKYHAACHLAPAAVRTLTVRLSQIGFPLNLSDYDEELAATIIEVLSLHLEGVALERIHGSDVVEKAVHLLLDNKAMRNQKVQRTEAGRSASETNRTASAVGSRR